ncbi:MAG: helix-turn-helix domain-containing protein [Clostridia bacterium]|nr:helix-turn-helix domain-containing protein [Clostridia bacterium]
MQFLEVSYNDNKVYSKRLNAHSHDYYELHFLLEGEKQFYVDNKIYDLTPTSLALSKPFSLHHFNGGPHKRILVNITPAFLSPTQTKFLDELSKKAVITFSEERSAKINKTLYKMLEVKNSPSPDKEIELSLLLGKLFYLVSSYQEHNTILDKSDSKEFIHPRFLSIIEYVTSNYTKQITLEELSNKFFLSKNYICKHFKKIMNCTIIEYQTSLRIEEAKKLCYYTAKPLNQIATQLGFKTEQYFISCFKKHVGTTPFKYRNQCVKDV